MIFRKLLLRRIFARFESHLTAQQVDEIFGHFSEWESLKLLLPRWVSRVFATSGLTEADALTALVRMIDQALADAEKSRISERTEEPDAPQVSVSADQGS